MSWYVSKRQAMSSHVSKISKRDTLCPISNWPKRDRLCLVLSQNFLRETGYVLSCVEFFKLRQAMSCHVSNFSKKDRLCLVLSRIFWTETGMSCLKFFSERQAMSCHVSKNSKRDRLCLVSFSGSPVHHWVTNSQNRKSRWIKIEFGEIKVFIYLC